MRGLGASQIRINELLIRGPVPLVIICRWWLRTYRVLRAFSRQTPRQKVFALTCGMKSKRNAGLECHTSHSISALLLWKVFNSRGDGPPLRYYFPLQSPTLKANEADIPGTTRPHPPPGLTPEYPMRALRLRPGRPRSQRPPGSTARPAPTNVHGTAMSRVSRAKNALNV